jgi:2,3-bisphosphoglycerate-dependent phosphoglycerate mutase
MRLILIRHAESEHAVNNIVGGPLGCQGLTPRGRQQARRLAERLRRTDELADCTALLTSPFPRARPRTGNGRDFAAGAAAHGR